MPRKGPGTPAGALPASGAAVTLCQAHGRLTRCRDGFCPRRDHWRPQSPVTCALLGMLSAGQTRLNAQSLTAMISRSFRGLVRMFLVWKSPPREHSGTQASILQVPRVLCIQPVGGNRQGRPVTAVLRTRTWPCQGARWAPRKHLRGAENGRKAPRREAGEGPFEESPFWGGAAWRGPAEARSLGLSRRARGPGAAVPRAPSLACHCKQGSPRGTRLLCSPCRPTASQYRRPHPLP